MASGPESSFNQLPSELQVIILRYVFEPDPEQYLIYLGNGEPDPNPLASRREQLKPLRLVSRVFHDAVTPTIFASIHLHASRLSLRRAESVADSRFASYVREIVYHEGTFAGSSLDVKVYNQMLNSHRRRQDYPKDYHWASFEILYNNYVDEVHSCEDFEGFETTRMDALLRRLPRCITFSILPSSTQWCDPATSAYTLRRTGLSYLPRSRPTKGVGTSSFINAMAGWKPRALNLSNFAYQKTSAVIDAALRKDSPSNAELASENWADQLVYLRLGWPNGGRFPFEGTMDIFVYIRLLAFFLKHCHNLVHLELTHGFDVPPDLPLFTGAPLLKLTHLTISKGSMDGQWAEETLTRYIQDLGSTLKHLRFDHVSIQRYTDRSTPQSRNQGSILRLLYNISPHTNLESCTGLDTVGDIKTKVQWKEEFVLPGYKPGKRVLLDKIEDAVCGRRSWPERFTMESYQLNDAAATFERVLVTDEMAFVFSNWQDTVDPWDFDDGDVDQSSDTTKIVEQSQELTLQDEMKEQTNNSRVALRTGVKLKAGRSKRNRLRKIFGLD